MSDLASFAESNLPLLERYIFAEDKQQFLKTLTLPEQKRFFDLLLNPIVDKEKQIMQSLGLSSEVKTELYQAKVMRELQAATSLEQKSDAIDKVRKLNSNIYFDFPKPVEFASNSSYHQSEGVKKEVQSKLETEQSVTDVVLRVIKEDSSNVAKISSYGLKNFPLEKMEDLNQQSFGIIFTKTDILRSLESKAVAKLLARLITKMSAQKHTSESEEFPVELFTTLTADQVKEVQKLLPHLFNNQNFVQQLFRQQYEESLSKYKPISQLSFNEIEEKRKRCESIIKELSQGNNEFNSYFIEKLTEEILLLDESIVDSKEELFIDYLKNLKSFTFDNFDHAFKKERVNEYGKNKYMREMYGTLTYLDSTRVSQSDIISRTIISLFKKNDSSTVDKLSHYINKKYLIKEEAKIKLEQGRNAEISNIHDLFTADELNQIKEKKEITLIDKNKKIFRANEAVELSVKWKNVKQISVKIYKFDLEKQYLQNGEDVSEDINLKFLKPSSTFTVNSKTQDPFEVIDETISLDDLKDKLGLFIVELEGDTITSRAVIRKGSIFHKNRLIPEGHQLSFYDQEGKKIDELTIWRQEKKIDVKGSYIIPFGSQGREKLIASYRDYAEVIWVDIASEDYSFNIDYVYHSESFVVGNKAKIILRTELKLQEENVSLHRLNKVTVKVATINNQDIASTIVLENVKFVDNQDYVVELPIKSYIKSFSVVVQAEISKLNKETQRLNSSKSISINLEENNNNFVDMYLEKAASGEYTLKVRGKNGEPISYAETSVSYEQFGADFSFSKQLTSNEQGELQLGKLLQVKKLTITVNSNGFSSVRTWLINNYSQSISYGGTIYSDSYKIYLKEGESFSLPLPCQLNLNQDIVFFHENKVTKLTKNTIDSIKLTDSKLTTDGLETGTYTLILLRLDRRIDIQVIKGKNWIRNSIIDENNVVYETSNKDKGYVALGEIKASVVEDKVQYSIDIHSQKDELPKDLRVHIFAKNYIDSDNPTFFNPAQYIKCPRTDIQCIQIKQSSYFNNKNLSDETAYVLNRKKQPITNGNNLQKPHIFLKRQQVRQTKQNDEVLQKEGEYAMQKMLRAKRCSAPRAQMMDMCYASNQRMANLYGGYGLAGSVNVTIQRSLNSHNNFLLKVGHLNHNLRKIEGVSVPLGYNQIVVYLFTNNISIKKEYSLPNSLCETLKLTHNALQDVDKKSGWTMSRQIYPVKKGEKKVISRNSTWTSVSLANIAQYAKNLGITLPEWILSWSSYTEQKKQEVYDKQICHELNFFIYKRDKEFFNRVVKPFISNKVIKTFIDLYLIGSDQILQYKHAHLLEKLNYFERALLAEKLAFFGKTTEASNLANSLQLPLKNIKQTNEVFKRFFETILNAKKDDSSRNKPYMQPMAQPFYAAPPPGFGGKMQNLQYAERQQCCFVNECHMEMACDEEGEDEAAHCSLGAGNRFEKAQQAYKPGFKETEKTKEYTETTYSGVINSSESSRIVPPSLFWADLAQHYSSENASEDFLSEKFSYLTQKIEFVLACAVLPTEIQSEFELGNHENNYEIKANSSFLIFVREVKSLPFEEFKSILLNQRFFDPQNKYYYDEDGSQIEKEVTSFLVQKPYTIQTIITNISGNNLQIQLLIDIPEGSIPLKSHEETQIVNFSLPAYSTKTFERDFYFPQEGTYSLYPANACKGLNISAKANSQTALIVAKTAPTSNIETLDNILRNGSDKVILEYLSTKNIFDSNIFDFRLILWKLKDKPFYDECLKIFEARSFFNPIIWSFSFLHEDIDRIKQFIQNSNTELGLPALSLPIFEYYPYFSSRAHKFVDESKSTIRVQQFKENYAKFLYSSVFSSKLGDASILLTHIYYLLLQDKIAQARIIYSRVKPEHKAQLKIQFDYIDCYLDMYTGAETNYETAKTISKLYENYPVISWRKLFRDVSSALFQSMDEETDESAKSEQVTFSTTVVNAGKQININRPANTRVVVNFYKIDLELYFSQYPFEEVKISSAIAPTRNTEFNEAEFKVEKIDRKDYQDLQNMIVEVYEYKPNVAVKKITSFLWTNPDVKIKFNQNLGDLKVFYKQSKSTTSYCKVYSRGSKGDKFYRDGYTDTIATFRYALDLKDVTEFSILVLTDNGGSIHRVKPPTVQ